MIDITQEDYNLLKQSEIELRMRIYVLNKDGTVLKNIDYVIDGGNLNNDNSSIMRRSFSVTLSIDDGYSGLYEESIEWLNKDLQVFIGILNKRTNEYKWYPQGFYVIANANMSNNEAARSISISCNDFMAKLDGTKNGQIGALITKIPAYTEDALGNPLVYTVIKDAMKQVLSQIAGITKFVVDDIGEYKGIEEYNNDYLTYREANPLWDKLPYDLEFSSGSNVASIIQTITELYPNYDSKMDESGVFTVGMIPSCYDDPIIINNDNIQECIISEDASVDMTKVRNICHVWGKVFEVDRYAATSTFSSNAYNITLTNYTAYATGDIIALKTSAISVVDQRININGIGSIRIYDENSDTTISAGLLENAKDYVFKYKKEYVEGVYTEKFYLLGTYQVQAMSVLTDGSIIVDGYLHTDGLLYDKYSKEYFQKKYECQTVELNIIPNSPFTVQMLGEIIDVKTGDIYDNITSDSVALSWAKYINWQNCRLTDNITIQTIIMPWISEYIKTSFITDGSTEENQYIISSYEHDFTNAISTINMYRFYPLYEQEGYYIIRNGITNFIYSYYVRNNINCTSSLDNGSFHINPIINTEESFCEEFIISGDVIDITDYNYTEIIFGNCNASNVHYDIYGYSISPGGVKADCSLFSINSVSGSNMSNQTFTINNGWFATGYNYIFGGIWVRAHSSIRATSESANIKSIRFY